MIWYKTGTVSVTQGSTTVVGVGTAWVDNVQLGDGLRGPDGAVYEIVERASNTAMTIFPPYAGPSANEQSYVIAPVPGRTKALADRAASMLDGLDNDLELAVDQAKIQTEGLVAAASVTLDAKVLAAEDAAQMAYSVGRIYPNAGAGVDPDGDPTANPPIAPGVPNGEYFLFISADTTRVFELARNVNGAAVIQNKSIADNRLLNALRPERVTFDRPIIYDNANLLGGGAGSIYIPQTFSLYRAGEGFDKTLTPVSSELAGYVKAASTGVNSLFTVYADLSVLRAGGTAAVKTISGLNFAPDALGPDYEHLVTTRGTGYNSPHRVLTSIDLENGRLSFNRPLILQRTRAGTLELLIPSGSAWRADRGLVSFGPSVGRYISQPISNSPTVRRHLFSWPLYTAAGSAGALTTGDSTSSPHEGWLTDMIATSQNESVHPCGHAIAGLVVGGSKANACRFGLDPTDVTRKSGGEPVEITDQALLDEGFQVAWGNAGADAMAYGMDVHDGARSANYFCRIGQAVERGLPGNDGVGDFVVPTLQIHYTDGSQATSLNPGLERHFNSRTAFYVANGRVPAGKVISHILVGSSGMTGRSIAFFGLQWYSGAEPCYWVDRLDYPTLPSVREELDYLKKSTYTRPRLLVAPVITGDLTVGSTMEGSTGTWEGNPEPLSYRFQWLRDGIPIPGATKKTRIRTAEDANHLIGLCVMAVSPAGNRVAFATPRGVGKTWIILAAGQSNMQGWGTMAYLSNKALDPTMPRLRELVRALGEDMVDDGRFARKTSEGWVGTNHALTVANGVLTATATANNFGNVEYALTGVAAGKKHLVSVRVKTPEARPIAVKGLSPEKVAYVRDTVANNGSVVDFEFTPGATKATLQLLTTLNQPVIGDQFTVTDVSCRPFLGSGLPTTVEASLPLTWPDPDGSHAQAWGVSPAYSMARALLDAGAAQVVIVPVAQGSSKLYNGPWSVGGSLYENATARLTEALQLFPGAEVVMPFAQGESDTELGVTQAQYYGALTPMIAGIRAVPGAEDMKVIIGGMAPELIARFPAGPGIDAAHRAAAANLENVVYVAGPAGHLQTDQWHFDVAANRSRGIDWANALLWS